MKILIAFFIFFLCISCKWIISPFDRYIIDRNGIKSKTGCTIKNMSISQLNLDHSNLNDIRPNAKNEVTRYCCWLNKNSKGSSSISFWKANSNYRWFLCKWDMSIIENDSLNNLTLQEKLDYTKRMEQIRLKDKNFVHRDSFPFIIQKGYVYQVFGLCDVEGSFYFCLDSTDNLIVQYVDRGPW